MSNSTSTKLAHVQILRALAVSAVVVFHVNPTLLPGGYLGVDIFFVISGFVITRSLIKEYKKNNGIDLRSFYIRRVNRLFPSFALVAGFIIVTTALLEVPGNNQQLIYEIVLFSLFGFGNVAMATKTGGYFDPSSISNPALHFWSLSVEEQFYAVFPITLLMSAVLFGRHRNQNLIFKVPAFSMFISSFTLFLLSVASKELSNSLFFGFYSPFTRFWELSVGVLIAVGYHWKTKSFLTLTRLLWFGVGLSIVISSLVFGLSRTDVLPVDLVIPVIGTAMIIFFGGNEESERKSSLGFGWQPLLYLGAISYSLYLWHWPIQVISLNISPEQTTLDQIAVVAISIFLATVTYELIEKRPTLTLTKPKTNVRKHLARAIALSTILAAFMFFNSNFWFRSWPDYISTAKDNVAWKSDCVQYPINLKECRFNDLNSPGQPKIFLIGDSQAYSISDGVVAAGSKLNYSILVSSLPGCPFNTHQTLGGRGTNCSQWQASVTRLIAKEKPEIVLIANRTKNYATSGAVSKWNLMDYGNATPQESPMVYEQGMVEILKKVASFGPHVIIAGTLPLIPDQLFSSTVLSIALEQIRGTHPNGVREKISWDIESEKLERRVAQLTDADFIAVQQLLCPTQDFCEPMLNGVEKFADSSHLTSAGSLSLAGAFESKILDVRN